MEYDESLSGRRFYRDRDRGIIFGVCAGIADYFGFNLRVFRILTVIAFLFFGPIGIFAYVVLALLVPAKPRAKKPPREEERVFRQAMRSEPRATIRDVHRRFQKVESRVARLERYVTSPRFNLDQEFENL